MSSSGCAFSKMTRGLGACGREPPCGIDQPTMTEEDVVVVGGMACNGCAPFKK